MISNLISNGSSTYVVLMYYESQNILGAPLHYVFYFNGKYSTVIY